MQPAKNVTQITKVQDVFNFDGFDVRVDLDDEGEPLFCASDVARCLGYADPKKAVWDHCKGVLKRNTLTSGGKQTLNFIPESDLYRLVLRSRLEGAERFTDWITETVIPSIRKTGGYRIQSVPDYPTLLEDHAKLLREKAISEAENVKLLRQAEKDEPFTIAGRALLKTNTETLIGVFSKSVKIDDRVMGQNKMFRFLRDRNIMFKKEVNGSPTNLPYQKHIDAGRFIVRKGERPNSSGEMVMCFTSYITPKGQGYVINRLKKDPEFKDRTIEIDPDPKKY